MTARAMGHCAWVWMPLAWVAGVVVQLQQPVLWPVGVYMFFCGLAVALVALSVAVVQWGPPAAAHPGWRRRAPLVVVGLAVVLLAAGSTGWRAAHHQAQVLAAQWQGQTLLLTGQVDDLPRRTPLGWRFSVQVEQVQWPLPAQDTAAGTRTPSAARWQAPVAVPAAGLPGRVTLSWRAQDGGAVPQAGERWRLAVRLRQPHGLANPHGFDTELWMWSEGLGASGTVRMTATDPPPVRLAAARYGLQPLREHLRNQIRQRVADDRAAGLLAALVVGDQAAIDSADWDVFRATGVAHLVSISGLHITLWAWLCTGLVGWAWRWAPAVSARWGSRLLLACPAPVAALWGGGVLALAYAVFSGWGIPAQRTVLMLAVVWGLRLLGRRWPWPVVGVVVMAVVLVWEPWAWLQPGFWLSFVAVGVLMALDSDAHARGWGKLVGLLRTQWSITLALAPLTLMWFGQVSVVGLLANLVAIPVATLLITPLALAGAVWPALWQLAAWLLQAGLQWLAWLAAWPWASLMLPHPPAVLAFAAVAGGLLLALPAPPRLRWLGLACVLPALLWQPPRPAQGEFEVLAADVGQGSAVLIRTASTSVLVDAGPQWGPQSDAGQRVLKPLLHALGERPSHMVLTHRDGDHVGGALSLLGDQPTAAVWASFDPPALVSALSDPAQAQAVLARPPPWTRCQAGQSWELDGVRFEVLHPAPRHLEASTSSNNLSCVLWVRGRHRSALLTGDLEAALEAELVQANPGLRADWLLAPHHGSRTSSSPALLDAVRPTHVVVQAGYLSRYGHPAAQTVRAYEERGIAWVATPACGAARWRSVAPQSLDCQRQQRVRYWQWQAPQKSREETRTEPAPDPD